MDTLPPELLYIIPFFQLTSLIAARGVNIRWRSFSHTASLHPARKALLDLYLAAIVHPNFPSLVEALQPQIHEFDREACIADLTSRGCVLPDVFELWVLEWPSEAVHFWAWPGRTLPEPCLGNHGVARAMDHANYWGDLLGQRVGEITRAIPTIDTIPVPKKEAPSVGSVTCKGLALWGNRYGAGVARLWLVVDANERINDRRMGRLLGTHEYVNEPHRTRHPMRYISYDAPFEAGNLIGFLDLLDLSHDGLEYTLEVFT